MNQEKIIRNKLFISRLSSLMKENSITQMQLRDKSGVSQGAISDYLKGKSEPKSSALCALSKVFNVSLDFLWGISDDKIGIPIKPSSDDADWEKRALESEERLERMGYILGELFALAKIGSKEK